MKRLCVVKIGGHIVDDSRALQGFLRDFSVLDGPKILIHGGGKSVSGMSARLGIPVSMVEGRRITDAATLEVVVMMLAGVANKQIVAALQSLECNAIGLTGADGGTILAQKRPLRGAINYGMVGDIAQVASERIERLLAFGFVPVFTALTHDGKGQLLNTNADTVASALAVSMSEYYRTEIFYCFEKSGVLLELSDEASVVHRIDRRVYNDLHEKGCLQGGMLPKIDNAFAALDAGVQRVWIGLASDMRDAALGSRTCGTTIIL